jgi:hypothetical protein
MINPYIPEYGTATTTETYGKQLLITIREDVLASSRYLSSVSLRINIETLETVNNILDRLSRLAVRLDHETIIDLLSRSIVFPILTLLERIRESMEEIGLRIGEHFQVEISRWVDEEVEGWNYLQIKVTLLGSVIDRFVLLKSLISMATQILPQQVRQEVVISVE